jgi:hypothetical protein
LKNDTLRLSMKKENTEFFIFLSNRNTKILLEWDKMLKNTFLKKSSDKIKREKLRSKVLSELGISIELDNNRFKSFGEKNLLDLQKNSDLVFMEIKRNADFENFDDLHENTYQKNPIKKKEKIIHQSPNSNNHKPNESPNGESISLNNQKKNSITTRIEKTEFTNFLSIQNVSIYKNLISGNILSKDVPSNTTQLNKNPSHLSMPHFALSSHDLVAQFGINKNIILEQVKTSKEEEKFIRRKRSISWNQSDFKFSSRKTLLEADDFNSLFLSKDDNHTNNSYYSQGAMLYKEDFHGALNSSPIKLNGSMEEKNSLDIIFNSSPDPNQDQSTKNPIQELSGYEEDSSLSFQSKSISSEISKSSMEDPKSYKNSFISTYHVWNQTFQKAFDIIHNNHINPNEVVIDYQEMMCNIESEFINFSNKFGEIIINELYTPLEQKTIKPSKIGGIIGKKKKFFFFIFFYQNFLLEYFFL